MYSITGDISDIQNMHTFPPVVQDHILQFQDTFSTSLNEGRSIKNDPVRIGIDENAPKPYRCTKARPTLALWRNQANDVLDGLIETRMVRKVSNLIRQYIARSSPIGLLPISEEGWANEGPDEAGEECIPLLDDTDIHLCHYVESYDDLPRLPRLISKTRTGKTAICTTLLDTGTTACLISEKVAREQNLNIQETSHINLRGAGG